MLPLLIFVVIGLVVGENEGVSAAVRAPYSGSLSTARCGEGCSSANFTVLMFGRQSMLTDYTMMACCTYQKHRMCIPVPLSSPLVFGSWAGLSSIGCPEEALFFVELTPHAPNASSVGVLSCWSDNATWYQDTCTPGISSTSSAPFRVASLHGGHHLRKHHRGSGVTTRAADSKGPGQASVASNFFSADIELTMAVPTEQASTLTYCFSTIDFTTVGLSLQECASFDFPYNKTVCQPAVPMQVSGFTRPYSATYPNKSIVVYKTNIVNITPRVLAAGFIGYGPLIEDICATGV
eukprot:TRINITY_DN13276_c0_g1_i1.p1 TRINITY_DN13276_c0_g1~~TRINITY_DN13276_c0_g1_i1.p1  ORF type:complete len:293 (-),score=26.38 TRINITY_DN13276_c0_g1_i1:267-1145(-)